MVDYYYRPQKHIPGIKQHIYINYCKENSENEKIGDSAIYIKKDDPFESIYNIPFQKQNESEQILEENVSEVSIPVRTTGCGIPLVHWKKTIPKSQPP